MSSLKFWKPGTVGPGSTLDRSTANDGDIVASAPSTGYLSIQSQRERLPIFKYKDRVLHCIEKYQVVVVVGETGSGKTTQIPQYLHEAGWSADGNVIACTQPRRVAVTSVAARTATEVGTVLGDEVGYTIRFEDVSSKERTRICYLTDGVLFRETLVDPLLSRYSVIMVDEAHERSVYTDLVLAVLKKICKRRSSLKIVISSATLDAIAFQEFFRSGDNSDMAIVVSLEGRMYPIEVAYIQEPTSDYVRQAAETIMAIHKTPSTGDILTFLTGREEIERCLELLEDYVATLPKQLQTLVPLPLYAGLATTEQLQVFEPTARGYRKVVIATNVAEASVTIDGVRYVIDSGFVKMRTYNPRSGLSSLTVVPISQASAIQRAGRAGRTSDGVCYRLYTNETYNNLAHTTAPEIVRTDLTSPIVQLKALGIDNLMKLEWLTIPPSETIVRCLSALIADGVIGTDGHLTQIGQKVAEVPLEVRLACMLFRSEEYRCGDEILTIAAMTAVQDIFVIPPGAPGASAELERRKFIAEEGDHLTLLNAYNAFVRYGKSSSWCKSHALSFRALSRAVSIRGQLKKYMQRFSLPIESCQGDAKRLRQCLVTAYRRNGARWVADGTYRSIQGDETLYVHPNSVLFTRKPRSGWVVFHEMEETTKIQISIITEVEPEWLLDLKV